MAGGSRVAVCIGGLTAAWISLTPPPAVAQSIGLCGFDDAKLSFVGDPITQSTCLLRPVYPYAKVGPGRPLPPTLSRLVGQPVALSRDMIFTSLQNIGAATLAETLGQPTSRARNNASGAPLARYFVIHDTSTPNLGAEGAFPTDIDSSKKVNSFGYYASGEKSKAHVFVNRRGELAVRRDFAIPWRATKLELRRDISPLKGLFVHIELVQPRLNDSRGIDARAPQPGFSSAQYERLALLYAVASFRAGRWMIPAFHAVVDSKISGGHDDPQNFDLDAFDRAVEALTTRLSAAVMPHYSAMSMGDRAVSASVAAIPTLRASLYYTALESDYRRGTEAGFRDRSGAVIRRVSSEFYRKAEIEGSAKLDDGRVINVDSRVDGAWRWKLVPQAYGLDAIGCGLVPFRSAAVDPTVVPLRTKLMVPETVGMQIPGGGMHDGIWYAVDTGSAITADRIDLFTGAGIAAMQIPRQHGIGHLQGLRVTSQGRIENCPPQ